MNIPGANLLAVANTVIAQQTVKLSVWLSNTLNAGGVSVPTYAAAVDLRANVQAVTRAMYVAYNLDVQKSYVLLYTAQSLRDVKRGGSCDKIDFAGRRYDVESLTDWKNIDGWLGSICVDVGATPA